MWDEKPVQELVSKLPDVINEANLERIQSIIDYDKYGCSFDLGYDLCGQYAPFCSECDKDHIYPCAYSYLKMKQAEGMNISIEGDDRPNDGLRVARAKRPTSKKSTK